MKKSFSYRNYPILGKLKNKKLGELPIYESDYANAFFLQPYLSYVWKKYVNEFSKEIIYATRPFMETAEKARKSLMDLYYDIIMNNSGDLSISKTIITGNYIYMIYYNVVSCMEGFELAMYVFHKNGAPVAISINNDSKKIYNHRWISNYYNIKKEEEEKIDSFITMQIYTCLLVHLFKEYAEVETNILYPHKKLREINCKYVNNTDIKITTLDSKWFTTLIKSNEFKVRGHFRLQPKKDEKGNWTRELIWINDFMKTGYIAPARKLKKEVDL